MHTIQVWAVKFLSFSVRGLQTPTTVVRAEITESVSLKTKDRSSGQSVAGKDVEMQPNEETNHRTYYHQTIEGNEAHFPKTLKEDKPPHVHSLAVLTVFSAAEHQAASSREEAGLSFSAETV
ncbi:unnamed protein product [Calypogeia fissa]